MAELTIGHLTEAIQVEGQESEKRDNAQLKELANLNKSFAQYFKAQAQEKLDDLEEKRESKNKSPSAGQPLFKDMVADAKGFGFLGVIAAIGAAVTGLLVGVLDGLRDSFKLITPKFIRTAFSNRVIKPITMFFDAVGDIFRKAGTGQILKGDTFKVFGRFTSTLQDIATKFKSVIRGVRTGSDEFFKFFGRVGDFFRSIGRNIKAFILSSDVIRSQLRNLKKLGESFQVFAKSADAAKDATSIFSKLGDVIKPFFNVFRRLGRFLGGPITVAIFSIVDGFIGAFKGFTETEGGLFAKITGAISGAISGVISGFVGGLLDLGKMLVGFVAGLFGADDFKAKLAEFSFQEMIFDGLMFPFRAIMSLFDGEEGNMFSDLASNIIDGIKDIFSSITGFVKQKFKAIGSSIAGFFGLGGDEEEPAVKEIKNGQVVSQVENIPVEPMVPENYVPLAERSTEDKAAYFDQQEERFRAQIKRNQDRLAAMTPEQRAGDRDRIGSSTARIEDLQRKIAELDQGRRDLNVPIVDASTTTTNNSSSSTALVDASPATDDLDRVA